MYSISWATTESYTLVGDMRSVLAIADDLEKKKIYFTITNVSVGQVKQSQLGCGGFSYWKDPWWVEND